MRATGQIKFTRHSAGVVSSEWIGGSRVAISYPLIQELTGERPHIGQVVTAGEYTLLLVGIEFFSKGQGYTDSYVAMRDGLLARMVVKYWRWIEDHAVGLWLWESKWLRRRKVIEGEVIPKWSLAGMLIRPMI